MTSPKGRTVSGTPTGERARSGGSAQADLSVARPAPAGADMKHCVCRRSASFFSLRSFILVIAGLDPAIHADAKLGRTCRMSFRKPHVSMDHRVKPGGDEESGRRCLTFASENAGRESVAYSCRPARASNCLARTRCGRSYITPPMPTTPAPGAPAKASITARACATALGEGVNTSLMIGTCAG